MYYTICVQLFKAPRGYLSPYRYTAFIPGGRADIPWAYWAIKNKDIYIWKDYSRTHWLWNMDSKNNCQYI